MDEFQKMLEKADIGSIRDFLLWDFEFSKEKVTASCRDRIESSFDALFQKAEALFLSGNGDSSAFLMRYWIFQWYRMKCIWNWELS